MKTVLKSVLALLVAVPVLMSTEASFANTAANTAIVNKAVLTYNGGLTAESSVSVKVDLVPAKPNVSISSGVGVYQGVDTPAITNTVTITSSANGPAVYTVTPFMDGSTNSAGASVGNGGSSTLGATVTAGTGGTTFIIVPAPIGTKTDADSEVNGIKVNDVIVFTINGSTYAPTVTSTLYNPASDTFKINWSNAQAVPEANVLGAGVQVGERQEVTISVLPGTINTLGAELTVTVRADVTAANFETASATTAPENNWTSTPASITFQKYSRNVTSKVAGTGTAHSAPIEGNTGAGALPYYTGGVTGKPGDVIEYVIMAANSGANDLTSCAISDRVPTNYVTELLTPYTGSGHIFYIDTNGTASTIIAGASDSLASYVAASTPNLIVNVGEDAGNSTAGTIPIGKSVTIAYQVKIK